METTTTSQHGRQRRRLGLLALGALALAVVAIACHPSGRHLYSVHDGITNEGICIDLQNGVNVPFATPQAKVTEALVEQFPEGNWNSLSRINFLIASFDCDDFSQPPAFLIEFHIYDAGQSACPNNNPCVRGIDPSQVGPHVHYDKVEIIMDEDMLLDPEYAVDTGLPQPLFVPNNHIINHEMGHALGLADISGPGIGLDQCVYQGEDIRSIMHSTVGCGPNFSAYVQPLKGDRDMVELIGAEEH